MKAFFAHFFISLHLFVFYINSVAYASARRMNSPQICCFSQPCVMHYECAVTLHLHVDFKLHFKISQTKNKVPRNNKEKARVIFYISS